MSATIMQVAPDLPEVDRRDVAAVALRSGIDGLIVSNTTMHRPQLVADHPCGHEVCRPHVLCKKASYMVSSRCPCFMVCT